MKCISPKLIYPHRSVEWVDTHDEYPVSVPCGKCLACLSNKRSEWAFRLEQEYKYSNSAHFVTLTYDEKHVRSNGSLVKKHLQDYLKRLRKKDEQSRIRYYAVGEYGTRSGRPHYHVLLFNTSEANVRASWVDGRGEPIGLTHIGSVNGASVAYVLKYMVLPSADPFSSQKEKPFAVMSRAYGIGGRYLSDLMVAWHREDDRNYVIREGVKIRLCRFYKSKIWYNENDKERVSKTSLVKSIQDSEKEKKYYKDHYGLNWEKYMTEARDAVLGRIKSKVAYTQTL